MRDKALLDDSERIDIITEKMHFLNEMYDNNDDESTEAIRQRIYQELDYDDGDLATTSLKDLAVIYGKSIKCSFMVANHQPITMIYYQCKECETGPYCLSCMLSCKCNTDGHVMEKLQYGRPLRTVCACGLGALDKPCSFNDSNQSEENNEQDNQGDGGDPSKTTIYGKKYKYSNYFCLKLRALIGFESIDFNIKKDQDGNPDDNDDVFKDYLLDNLILLATGQVTEEFLTLFSSKYIYYNSAKLVSNHFATQDQLTAAGINPLMQQQFNITAALVSIAAGNAQVWAKHGKNLCDALEIKSTISMTCTQKVEKLLCLVNGGLLRRAKNQKKGPWCLNDYEEIFKQIFSPKTWRSAQLLHRLSLFSHDELVQICAETDEEISDLQDINDQVLIDGNIIMTKEFFGVGSNKGLRLSNGDFKLITKIIRTVSGDVNSLQYVLQRVGADTLSIEYYQELCKDDFRSQKFLFNALVGDVQSTVSDNIVYFINDMQNALYQLISTKIENDQYEAKDEKKNKSKAAWLLFY